MQDFRFIVQCNDQPTMKINVVAESFEKAQMYAKSMYASQYTTYADDRYNNWFITRRFSV